jgi:hypothetical protein
MRPVAVVSLAAALLAGTAAGWWGYPHWRMGRALQAITGDDPAAREAGWRWLLAPPLRPRAEGLTPRINASLNEASTVSLLEAADALRTMRQWGWDHQPAELVVRELALRAQSGNEVDQVLAARAMLSCPLHLDGGDVLPLFATLLTSPARDARAIALDGACMWLGPARAHRLAELSLPPGDLCLRRMSILARSWAERLEPTPAIEPEDPVGVVEAKLLYAVRAHPEDARAVLDVLAGWTSEPRPAFAAILRYSEDPQASTALGRLADAGDPTAALVLGAGPPESARRRWRRVLDDPATEPWRRRLAAWRLGGLGHRELATLLDADPAEPTGNVYAAALVAQRCLPRDRAVALAASWIVDLNDDYKRAGALLAALLGEHRALLRRAYELEDMAQVRAAQRVSLFALGVTVGEQDPVEVAYRVLSEPSGEFDPDPALCLLLVGHRPALALLTTLPPASAGTDWRAAVQQRAWLIERFVGPWHEAAGRPIAADLRAVRLHFDALEALRLLTQRRLRFDARERTFVAARGRSPGS